MVTAVFAASVLALSLLRMPAAARATEHATEQAGAHAGGQPPARSLRRDIAEGWDEFRSRTWLWVITLQFAFFNLLTWAPWMLLDPVQGHAYLGGAAVWGAIMAAQGAGAITAGLVWLGRRPAWSAAPRWSCCGRFVTSAGRTLNRRGQLNRGG